MAAAARAFSTLKRAASGSVSRCRERQRQPLGKAKARDNKGERGAVGAQIEIAGGGSDRCPGRLATGNGVRPERVAVHRSALGSKALAEPVAHIDDRDGVAVAPLVRQEQAPLGEVVVVQIAMEVEVVASQVGEDDRVEGDAHGPVEHEGVRADLKGAGLVAGVDHLTEHTLQVE